jgi:hypothetical protein
MRRSGISLYVYYSVRGTTKKRFGCRPEMEAKILPCKHIRVPPRLKSSLATVKNPLYGSMCRIVPV